MGVYNSNNKKPNKDITEISIIYNIKDEDYIRLFGDKFVENNKNICKMIIENKEYKIEAEYNVKNYRNSILKIQLIRINKVTNMSYMFDKCSSLLSLPDISKLNTNNVTDMNFIFGECSSLSSLPDISNWNTNNVTDMCYIIYGCSSLSSLPDISKWNINNVINMRSIFNG